MTPSAHPVPSPGAAPMSAVRITIDPVACAAYGYCAEILPEAISLDEWGYPIIDDRPLPADLMALAKRAARDCPKRAITLRQRQNP
jgi:ferredoxin